MLLENESFPEDTRVCLEAAALTDAGYQVMVVCPNCERGPRWETIAGVRVYRYPAPWPIGGFVGYVAEFAYSMVMAWAYGCYLLLRHGFDVVHVHMPPDMNALVGFCFRLFGKRLVVDHHDLSPELYQAQRNGNGSRVVERLLRRFEWLACRSADRLIATNQSQRQVQIERCGADPDRCFVVRNGPSEMFLDDVTPQLEIANRQEIVIGFVGMVGVQDGVDRFVESLAILKSRGRTFHAVIVGNGPAIEALRDLATAKHLNNEVTFTGVVPYDDVPSYIAAFDICVTPDPSNAYNDSCTTIKTIEYMALGKPIVAFATCENQFTAADAALYAEDNDVDQFTDLIERLIDDPALRQAMGEAGRVRVKQSLSWRHQQDELIALYANLIGPAPLPRPSTNLPATRVDESGVITKPAVAAK